MSWQDNIFYMSWHFTTKYLWLEPRGAGATGAAAPIAQTVRGQHGGNMLPFLPELHFEIRSLFTGIGIYNYF
jgi:hypothetical protein